MTDSMATDKRAISAISVFGTIARVGAHLLWEGVTQPKARAIHEVPRSPEALTPQWLTAALCSAIPNAKVVDYRLGRGSAGTSVRRQIEVHYNSTGQQADLPKSVFSKSTPTFLTRLANGISRTML